MQTSTSSATLDSAHYLFFGGLFESVRSLSFPCDAVGHVQMDELSDRARAAGAAKLPTNTRKAEEHHSPRGRFRHWRSQQWAAASIALWLFGAGSG